MRLEADGVQGLRFLTLYQQLLSSQTQLMETSRGVWSLKVRTDLHIARKIYHFLGVLLIIVLYEILTREQGLTTLSLFTLAFFFVDFFRLRIPFLNRLVYASFGGVLRKEEMKQMSGMAYLLSGALIVVLIFPKPIGMLSFLFLALGDPISSIVGILYGKDKIFGNKSVQGTLAGFVVCTLISTIYFQITGLMADRLVLVSLLGGIIGAFSEVLPVPKMDDNFTIPVISSILLYGMFLLFGGFN